LEILLNPTKQTNVETKIARNDPAHTEAGKSIKNAAGKEKLIMSTRLPEKALLLKRLKDAGFSCEIEYIITYDNDIYIVQAKDISKFDLKEMIKSEQHIIRHPRTSEAAFKGTV
jgi:hypothetical protein